MIQDQAVIHLFCVLFGVGILASCLYVVDVKHWLSTLKPGMVKWAKARKDSRF